MGWNCKNLGNGTWQITDDGISQGIPIAGFNGTIASNPQLTQNFGRILNEQINENEEIRLDSPNSYDGTFEYIGVAPIGSLSSSNVWMIIRVSWVNNKKVRFQYRSNVIWDNHTQGWPL